MHKRPPAERKDSPRAPIDLARVKKINELLTLFGEPKPQKIILETGAILLKEGSVQNNRAAILIIEGALEERKTLVVEGHGISEQVLSILREGDIANIQSITPELAAQPAYCSLHVKEGGYGYVLRPENIANLDSLGILLSSALRQNGKQAEVFASISRGYSTFKLLLQNLKEDFPKIPQNPVEFLQLYQKVSREVKELRKQAKQRAKREENFNRRVKELNDRVATLEHELQAARGQSTTSKKSLAAEQPSTLSTRVIELENAAHALRRDLSQEKRIREALEKRNAELMRELASQSSAISSAKFPSTAHLLDSEAFQDLEAEVKEHQANKENFRRAADHFEDLTKKMLRAIDLLARDNPGMAISEDVNMLMLGEDAPLRSCEQEARARHDSHNFKTVTLGSDSPEVAAAKASADKPAKNMRDSDRTDTAQKAPYTKHDPRAMSSRELTEQGKRETDRHLHDLDKHRALTENSVNKNRNAQNPLSGGDVDAILQEFVDNDSWQALNQGSMPSSPGFSAPSPEPESTRTKTKPFIPDENHPPVNSEVDIPREPKTPRVSQPSHPQASGYDSRKLNGRYLRPADKSDFTQDEVDSDVTPTVPYSHDDPPRAQRHRQDPPNLRQDSQSEQTRAWNDTVAAKPGDMPLDPDEVPTRREESGSHTAIDFPDEGTDVRQIQEDWRNAFNRKKDEPAPSSDEFVIPPSADIPPPPANLFSKIEPEVDDEPEMIADVDWATSGGTEAYRFDENGSITSERQPSSDDNIRNTRAYDFKAPGKPYKPKG